MEDASPPPSPNGKGNSSFPSERCLCGPTHSETHPLNYTKSWNFFFILVNQCCGWFSFWGNGFRVHWSMFIFLGDYPSKRLGVASVPQRLPVAWKAPRPRRLLFLLLLQPSCIRRWRPRTFVWEAMPLLDEKKKTVHKCWKGKAGWWLNQSLWKIWVIFFESSPKWRWK